MVKFEDEGNLDLLIDGCQGDIEIAGCMTMHMDIYDSSFIEIDLQNSKNITILTRDENNINIINKDKKEEN